MLDQWVKWHRYSGAVGAGNTSLRGFQAWKTELRAQPRINPRRGLLCLAAVVPLWLLANIPHTGLLAVVFGVLAFGSLLYGLANFAHCDPPSPDVGPGGEHPGRPGAAGPRSSGPRSSGGGSGPGAPRRNFAVYDVMAGGGQVAGPMTNERAWDWIDAAIAAGDRRVFNVSGAGHRRLSLAEVRRYAKTILVAVKGTTDEQRRTAAYLSTLSPEHQAQVYQSAVMDLGCSPTALQNMVPGPDIFGSLDEWLRVAEGWARGRGKQRYASGKKYWAQQQQASGQVSKGQAADMALLGLTQMPADAEGLVRAMHKRAKIDHPDCGGSTAAFMTMLAAYKRLLGCYEEKRAAA